MGENHSNVLTRLKDAVQNKNGFLTLIGETGTGKTTLTNFLLKTLEPNFIIVKVPDPDLECLDFFNFLAESFQIKKKFSSKGAFFVHFKFLLENRFFYVRVGSNRVLSQIPTYFRAPVLSCACAVDLVVGGSKSSSSSPPNMDRLRMISGANDALAAWRASRVGA